MNVNHKYSSYITLIPDKFVGTGIKRTNLYTTKLSKEEWNDKRKEFWGILIILLFRIKIRI